MRFLQSISKSIDAHNFEVDGEHLLSFRQVTDKIVRVSVLKNKQYKLDRSWAVRPKESEFKKEGFKREQMFFEKTFHQQLKE